MHRRLQAPRRESGRISMVGLLLLAGLVGGGYCAYVFGPYYVDNYQLKQVMREETNIAWRVGDDEMLRREILLKSTQIGRHAETVNGHTQLVGGLGLLADNIFIVRDGEAKKVTIQISYERAFELPIFNRAQVLHFSPAVEGSLEVNSW